MTTLIGGIMKVQGQHVTEPRLMRRVGGLLLLAGLLATPWLLPSARALEVVTVDGGAFTTKKIVLGDAGPVLGDKRNDVACWNGTEGYCLVSVIRLVARPEAYHGKRVMVHGYTVLSPEAYGLFLDDHAHFTESGLWLDLPPALRKTTVKFDGHYVRVLGTFSAIDHGHGYYAGTLSDITRFEVADDKPAAVQPRAKKSRPQPACLARTFTARYGACQAEHPPLCRKGQRARASVGTVDCGTFLPRLRS